MGIREQFDRTFRDFATDGVAASGRHEPLKSEIRKLGPIVEAQIAAAALAGGDLEAAEALIAPLLAAAEDARDFLNQALDAIPSTVADQLAAAVADATDAAETAQALADIARAATEAARDVVLAIDVDYPDQAAALAGAGEGDFFTYRSAEGYPVYAKKTGGAVVVLAGPYFSADKIGKAGGGTMQDVADDVAAIGTVTRRETNAPNFQRGTFNYLAPDASASDVMGGTVDQPNVVGVPLDVEEFTGDGVTPSFDVTPGFTVDNVAYANIRVWLVTKATAAETLWSETTHYAVAGKGTGTITITPNSLLTGASGLRVRCYRKASALNNPLLVYAPFGYDNASDGKGPMTLILGAHHTDLLNAGGHNGFVGGSSGYITGSSYSLTGQLSNRIVNGLAATVLGMRNYGTGTAPWVAGASNSAGSFAAAWGEGGDALAVYSTSMSRRGKARIGGDFVQGNGSAADASKGLSSVHRFALRRTVTSTTSTVMIPPSGSTSFAMDDNSSADVAARVYLRDPATKAFRTLDVRATVQRGVGAASTAVVGSGSSFVEVDKSPGLAPAAGQWEAQVIASTGAGAFAVIAKGENGRTLQAHGRVTAIYASDDVAAL